MPPDCDQLNLGGIFQEAAELLGRPASVGRILWLGRLIYPKRVGRETLADFDNLFEKLPNVIVSKVTLRITSDGRNPCLVFGKAYRTFKVSHWLPPVLPTMSNSVASVGLTRPPVPLVISDIYIQA